MSLTERKGVTMVELMIEIVPEKDEESNRTVGVENTLQFQ